MPATKQHTPVNGAQLQVQYSSGATTSCSPWHQTQTDQRHGQSGALSGDCAHQSCPSHTCQSSAVEVHKKRCVAFRIHTHPLHSACGRPFCSTAVSGSSGRMIPMSLASDNTCNCGASKHRATVAKCGCCANAPHPRRTSCSSSSCSTTQQVMGSCVSVDCYCTHVPFCANACLTTP